MGGIVLLSSIIFGGHKYIEATSLPKCDSEWAMNQAQEIVEYRNSYLNKLKSVGFNYILTPRTAEPISYDKDIKKYECRMLLSVRGASNEPVPQIINTYTGIGSRFYEYAEASVTIIPTEENITYQECVQNNAEYGIKYCKFSPDRFATVAKACGGTKNLPTLKELNALVDYLYGINVEECLKYIDDTTEGYFKYQDCFQKYSEGLNIKEDSDLVNELFLYKYPFLAANGDEQEQMNIIKLILVSGEERSSFYQYGWGIGRHGVYYTADIGRNSDYFTLCVNRD